MKASKILVSLVLSAMAFTASAQTLPEITISSSKGHSKLSLRTCAHNAGAICSLVFNGKEFIDDFDHGRQLQSASSFDGLGEYFNPTEAGSYHDWWNPSPSSSKLLAQAKIGENTLLTYSQMAFWYKYKGQALSNHKLLKIVTVGVDGMYNIIEYNTQFQVPADETHKSATFEVLTGYMHKSFDQFFILDDHNILYPLSAEPVGEQRHPIMFATNNLQYAIGVFSPDSPQPEYKEAGYGRWKFPDTTKWNNVYRVANPRGNYSFKTYIVVGDYYTVKDGLMYLKKKFNK